MTEISLSETESFSRIASLSDSLEGSPPYVVHGVAIGPGDITKGQTGKKKLWPGETLREAAASLQGRPLVRDHINTSKGVVGTVTDSRWRDGVGVLYEAELDDQELAKKVDNGRLEVSARIKHPPSDRLDIDEQSGALRVPRARFDNLSIVPTGAAPSNKVEIGSSEHLSDAEIQQEFDYITSETVYEENENYDIGELAEHRWHIPDWESSTKVGWDAPNMSDFGTDDLEQISNHFLLSTSGFPPEKFGDLKLPVVDENRFLNLRALRMAKRAASQINGVDEELEEKVKLIANTLIKARFPNESMTASLEEVDEEWDDEELTEYLREELDLTETEEAEESEEASDVDDEVDEEESSEEVSDDEVDDEVDEAENESETQYKRITVED